LSAEVRIDISPEDVMTHVRAGGLAMLSVHPWIRWPDRRPPHRGGHLVLAVDVDGGDTLVINNPSGLHDHSQQQFRISADQFRRFDAGRGVFFAPVVPSAP